MWFCFSAGGTGGLHRIDGMMRKQEYVDVQQQHLKTAAKNSKLGCGWVVQLIATCASGG